MNPTNPTIDKLDSILRLLAAHIKTDGYPETYIAEAEQAIIAWALEAVGSDELITDEDLRAYPEDSTERWEKEARNQLRREIKAKLTGGKP